MDGNGRWAAARGLTRGEGHRAGTAAARALVEECLALGIGHLTLYAFSTENWKRPKSEISFLFQLLVDFINGELAALEKRGVRLRVIGEAAALPLAARKALEHACARTAGNATMVLNLALNYSGREELARACRLCVEAGTSQELVNAQSIAGFLYTAGQPDPDLIIRTSGEMRLSNFMLFQAAYSELYFTETLWPDFGPEDLRLALKEYASRSRRFGGTGSEKKQVP